MIKFGCEYVSNLKELRRALEIRGPDKLKQLSKTGQLARQTLKQDDFGCLFTLDGTVQSKSKKENLLHLNKNIRTKTAKLKLC
jgi:hypothetical protein